MWLWVKRWRDWAMNELLPLPRLSVPPHGLHFSYEKAGLVVHDQPVPWNAEALLVEALLRLPPGAGRRKNDFTLRLPGHDPVPADTLRRLEPEDRHRVHFRLPPPAAAAAAEVVYRGRVIGRLDIPHLGRDEFVRHLRLQLATVFVRVGDDAVACQTFVAGQCRGLLTSAVLTSATSLVPLLDLDFQVEVRSERDGTAVRLPAALSSSQLSGRQALVTVAPRRHPRRIGVWHVRWLVGEQELANVRVRGISQRAFQRSLRVSDTRFVVQQGNGPMRVSRQVPTLGPGVRVGPCFLVSSSEPGMAGLCPLRVHAQVAGAVQPPVLLEQPTLVTDGPAMVAPGTLDAGELAQVTGFELRQGRTPLGVLSLCPAPTASFTSEGGFKPPQDFAWSPAADEELTDRLNRLLENKN